MEHVIGQILFNIESDSHIIPEFYGYMKLDKHIDNYKDIKIDINNVKLIKNRLLCTIIESNDKTLVGKNITLFHTKDKLNLDIYQNIKVKGINEINSI